MPRQLALFFTAVQFLTRAPTPRLVEFQPDWIAASARYFAVVGGLVGCVCGLVLLGASQLWTGALPALLAIAAGVLATGAFHEDGLADTLDGLGGGQTRERRLEIMKDSRIGTYGALALGLVLGAKVLALAEMPPLAAAAALVAAHAGGRAAAVAIMRLQTYAGDLALTKVKPTADGVTKRDAVLCLASAMLATAPVFCIEPMATLASLAGAGAAAALLGLWAVRALGGWVGDTLGAAEQVYEAGFLITFSAALAWS